MAELVLGRQSRESGTQCRRLVGATSGWGKPGELAEFGLTIRGACLGQTEPVEWHLVPKIAGATSVRGKPEDANCGCEATCNVDE